MKTLVYPFSTLWKQLNKPRLNKNILKHWLKTTLPCASGIKEANKTKAKQKITTRIFKTAS